MPVIGILSGAITGFISYIVLTYLKVPKIKKWSLLITVTLGNTALLGFPIVLGVFGSQALIRAIFFDIASLSTFLGLSVILMANFGGELKAVLKKVLLFPVLWAVIFGIVLNVFNIPIGPVLDKSLNYIGGATIHLIMIVLGLSLDFRAMLNNFKIASAVSLVKLFLFPSIATIIIFIVGLTGTEFTIGIVEAAMPSGMLTLVLAINYGLDYKLTTDCLFLSTVFSLITLPLIIGFL
jgi:predicted permease